jgi:acyl-CoA synthetase (AMP-forming)/AMP-acid ligase II
MRDPMLSSTVSTFVRAIGDTYADRPALVDNGVTVTYRALSDRSAAIAQGLLARGVGKGSRIGFMFGNTPDWVVVWAAIARTGAVPVPVSTFSKPPELVRIIAHADLQGVIAGRGYRTQDFIKNLSEAFADLSATESPDLRLTAAPYLRWITIFDHEAPAWAHPLSWLLAGADARVDDDLLAAAENSVHPTDPGLMIYTSGQSASPKGVLHSHGAVMAKVHYLRHMLELDADSVSHARLPFFWVGGLVMTLFTTLEAGGVVVFGEEPDQIGVFGSRGKNAIDPAGSKVSMWIGLGMTETFGIYSWGRDAPDPERSICTPLIDFEPGYDIKVINPVTGLPAGEGERGEMLVRGPTVMLGLHKVDRREAFDADGFYRTGDEVEVAGDALLFTGRLGDMIKTSGANVAPAEVEAELLSLEGIASAHVVAIPESKRGQLVGAAVVAEDGVQLDEVKILEILRERLSVYKVPNLLVVLTSDEVPVLPSLKIAKPQLAQLISERAAH